MARECFHYTITTLPGRKKPALFFPDKDAGAWKRIATFVSEETSKEFEEVIEKIAWEHKDIERGDRCPCCAPTGRI